MSTTHKRDSGLVITTVQGNPDEASDMEIAQRIAQTLNHHYPGHPFVVDVQGGGIVLRHMMITIVAESFLRRKGFGYLMPREKMGAPREIVKSAVEAGGNMLELFGLPRGPYTDQLPEIPKDWKQRQQRNFA